MGKLSAPSFEQAKFKVEGKYFAKYKIKII
jgi:hypothetical protein